MPLVNLKFFNIRQTGIISKPLLGSLCSTTFGHITLKNLPDIQWHMVNKIIILVKKTGSIIDYVAHIFFAQNATIFKTISYFNHLL